MFCLGTKSQLVLNRSSSETGTATTMTMASLVQILGPPPASNSVSGAATATAVDSLVSQTTDLQLSENDGGDAIMEVSGRPPMGLTENLSATFLSTGKPCLDFFFHVVPDTPAEQIVDRLRQAWASDPLTALKLVCNLRGVRGTGKSDREGFYAAALWLHQAHPKTLAMNARVLGDFGYLKDLPEILFRIVEGLEVRNKMREEWRNRKSNKKGSKFKRKGQKSKVSEKEEEGLIENVEEVVVDKDRARVLRKEREIAKARKALEKFNTDTKYRFLYDCVCDVFAELLKSDVQKLSSGEVQKISLAAKWCPSIDSSYDKATLLCEGIALRIFPRDSLPEYQAIEDAHYVFRVRDRLRKQVLVPLRRALQLPEVFMSANKWNDLPYGRVASVAMKTYKDLFSKHDKERFEGFLEDVKSGKAKIAAGALLPHQIIAGLKDNDEGKVAELQWARMVDDMSKKGKLSNCIAVCDVSGSMEGVPMEVSVALGLLVSELSEEPWKGKVITFSEHPQLHLIEGDSLLAKTEFVRCMDWGANTDFQQVFDRILEVAVEGKLSEDQMIKRVFVFSDMEFDEAKYVNYSSDDDSSGKDNTWDTDYEVIQRKFGEKGYSRVPEIVFWNLRNSSSTPVVAKQNGVALVSGFSKNLLTIFLEEGGIVNPEDVMALAIQGEEYKKLVVYD